MTASRNSRKITTTLWGATRLNSSVNGNPRFTLHTDDGDFTTQSDAAISYEVENITHRIPEGQGRAVTLTATRAGSVWDIEVKG